MPTATPIRNPEKISVCHPVRLSDVSVACDCSDLVPRFLAKRQLSARFDERREIWGRRSCCRVSFGVRSVQASGQGRISLEFQCEACFFPLSSSLIIRTRFLATKNLHADRRLLPELVPGAFLESSDGAICIIRYEKYGTILSDQFYREITTYL
jgi:hypothetical protein